MEKDVQKSIDHYRLAWKAAYGNNPAIGYRYARALMNNKQPVEAIDICHKVFSNFVLEKKVFQIFNVLFQLI